MSIGIPDQAKHRILLVDDDLDLATTLQLRLTTCGFDVITAADGTEAYWLAQSERPDLVITDLRMPHGHGDYLVECLKGRGDTCDIPVIVITGRRSEKVRRWMRLLGVRHYLYKPLQSEELLTAVESYLAVKQQNGNGQRVV